MSYQTVRMTLQWLRLKRELNVCVRILIVLSDEKRNSRRRQNLQPTVLKYGMQSRYTIASNYPTSFPLLFNCNATCWQTNSWNCTHCQSRCQKLWQHIMPDNTTAVGYRRCVSCHPFIIQTKQYIFAFKSSRPTKSLQKKSLHSKRKKNSLQKFWLKRKPYPF